MLYWLKNNWKLSAIISAVLLFGLWEVARGRIHNNTADVILLEGKAVFEEDQPDDVIESLLFVDVKGAINVPGVYQVTGNERVTDIIELAGGFTDEAAVHHLNLAEKVFDEMVIFVPNLDEEQNIPVSVGSDKVRINVATLEEIESLPGIGAVKAATIIQYREENGPFNSIDDLQQVTGIGAKTVENLEEFVQVP